MQMPAPASVAPPTSRALVYPTVWSIVRLVGALAILAAIANQLVVTVGNALQATTPYGSHVPTVIANFLSFFTIESNLGTAIVLILAAIWGLRSRGAGPEPRWLAIPLACTATYMIVTGVVYNTLLRNIELPQGTTVAWANEMMHVVAPLLMLADVLFAPRRRCLGWGIVGVIAAFPILWAVYTLVRANLVINPRTGAHSWYPYPFLDPANVGGYAGVAAYIAGIAVVIIVAGTGVVWASRKRGS
ncbi:Pr6Pr family membrane protein [Microbacterium capsulatum]|uniref:Pr6Pr family membrane protein n=1 Tax=Microbacterium capsulatum TaxID=3041921 RepID=A0ABU0XKW4_9MICO|nr:Pr6Pr family membrane protein [Microbacterium sp. ASV81]MDQ4215784.1 Pr6Pr family membrane protein [Microbacterium sp. ASV81]